MFGELLLPVMVLMRLFRVYAVVVVVAYLFPVIIALELNDVELQHLVILRFVRDSTDGLIDVLEPVVPVI